MNYKTTDSATLATMIRAFFKEVEPTIEYTVVTDTHFEIRTFQELLDLNSKYSIYVRCTFSLHLPALDWCNARFRAAGCCECVFLHYTTVYSLTNSEFGINYLFGSAEVFNAHTNKRIRIPCLYSRRFRKVKFSQLEAAAAHQKSGTHRQLTYQGSTYYFRKEAVIVGVEIELPTFYSIEAKKRLQKSGWHTSTDSSQLAGDIELVTRPYTIGYVKSKGFRQKLSEAYRIVDAPLQPAIYGNENEKQASGVHLHVSWENTGIKRGLVRSCIYYLLDTCGGRDWVLEAGGKSLPALENYAAYRVGDRNSRYNTVNELSVNHVELRYMNAHPNPAVVHERLQVACAVVELALELAYSFSTNNLLANVNTQLKRTPPRESQETCPFD